MSNSDTILRISGSSSTSRTRFWLLSECSATTALRVCVGATAYSPFRLVDCLRRHGEKQRKQSVHSISPLLWNQSICWESVRLAVGSIDERKQPRCAIGGTIGREPRRHARFQAWVGLVTIQLSTSQICRAPGDKDNQRVPSTPGPVGSTTSTSAARNRLAPDATTRARPGASAVSLPVRESMTAIVRGATAQLTARPSGTVTAWKTWLSPTFKVPAGDRMDSDVTVPEGRARSEEHTSELQSLAYLVCRLL